MAKTDNINSGLLASLLGGYAAEQTRKEARIYVVSFRHLLETLFIRTLKA